MEKSAPPAANEQSLSDKLLNFAAYPVSGAVGYWFAEPVVRNAVYDNLKGHGVFQDILGEHRKRRASLVQSALRGETPDLLKGTIEHHREYSRQVSQRLEQMGLGSISEQWQYIHKSQRQTALMNGFTAAAISLGALLTVANSRLVDYTAEPSR